MRDGTAFSVAKAAWLDALDQEREFARAFREEIHRHPRLSGDEADTRARFARATGISLSEVAQTGALGRIGPVDGPAIAIRGELDALPVTEDTPVGWASRNGVMHACGHDVHLAALAAVVRAARNVSLPYALVPMLQPPEETYPSGAFDIQVSGALEAADVRHVIGAHVHPSIATGAVAIGAGVVNAAAGELEIRFTGQSGHGAYPHLANDVVAAAAATALGLSEVVRRTISPMNPAVISVGQLIADAGAPNVLAGSAVIRATMRTTTHEDTAAIAEAVRQLAAGCATAYGVSAEVIHQDGEPMLSNDPDLAHVTESLLPDFGLVATEPMRSLGADDFSYYCDEFPSIMCFVGVGSADPEIRRTEPSLHDAQFLPDPNAVYRVAATMIAGYLGAAELIARDGK